MTDKYRLDDEADRAARSAAEAALISAMEEAKSNVHRLAGYLAGFDDGVKSQQVTATTMQTRGDDLYVQIGNGHVLIGRYPGSENFRDTDFIFTYEEWLVFVTAINAEISKEVGPKE